MTRPRKTKRTPEVPVCHSGQCSNHSFIFKPISADLRDRFACQIELCPKINNYTKKYRSLLPVLNRDGKEYTPCFILEGDESHYADFDEKYKHAHNLKKAQYDDSNRTILEPKHGRKSKICAVCRVQYLDYREHILSLAHKQRLRANAYNLYIEELVKDVQTHDREEPEPLESSDWSDSTRVPLSQEEFVSKHTRKELKLKQKDLERSTKWASGFGDQTDNMKSSMFERKDSERQEGWEQKTFLNMANKSFHIEDYLI